MHRFSLEDLLCHLTSKRGKSTFTNPYQQNYSSKKWFSHFASSILINKIPTQKSDFHHFANLREVILMKKHSRQISHVPLKIFLQNTFGNKPICLWYLCTSFNNCLPRLNNLQTCHKPLETFLSATMENVPQVEELSPSGTVE